MALKVVNYCRAIVIAHGKSEFMMAEYIKSNLRLNIAILGNKNGGSSVQVKGLLNYIKSDSRLKNLNAIQNRFLPQIVKKKMVGCKIFPIMDLDDCTSLEAEKYKSGEMFNSYCLNEYIVPIWCEPKFDIAMQKSNLIKTLPSDNQKVTTYSKIFPIAHSNGTNLEEIQEFRNRIKNNSHTNINVFVDYCIDIVSENLELKR